MGGPVVRLEGIINELRANHLLASTTVAIHKGIEQVVVHYVSHVIRDKRQILRTESTLDNSKYQY